MKRTILIVALSVAFAAVSLWLMLSGGRSKRATSLKYRLGGLLIGLTALASTACENGNGGGFMQTCYDPAPPPSNDHHWRDNVANSELRNSDVVILDYECEFGEEVTISLISDNEETDRVLCSETYNVKHGDNLLSFTINAGDYRGRAKLCVEYVNYEGEEHLTPHCVYVSIVD